MNTVVHSSRSHTWETPPAVYADLAAVYPFTLDPCCTPETAKCPTYFTPTDDGLSQPWTPHTCYVNPPYGREMAKWVAKAADEADRGATCVCLIPARTGAAMWHRIIFRRATAVYFVDGWIQFYRDGKPSGINAPFASAVVVFTPTGGPPTVGTWKFPKG